MHDKISDMIGFSCFLVGDEKDISIGDEFTPHWGIQYGMIEQMVQKMVCV